MTPLISFNVQIADDGNVNINASWTKPKTNEELEHIIKAAVASIMLINEGKFVALFQHAVAIAGEKHRDVETSKAILLTLQGNMQGAKKKGPIVPPTEAFHK